MKSFSITIFIIAIAALLTATIFASDIQTKTYNYKDFNSVEVSSGMRLTVTQSDSYYIEIKAGEKDFNLLKVEKKGDVLKIYYKSSFFSFRWGKHDRVEVNIKMPSLTGLDLSGGSIGNITMDVAAKNFSADVSGGSILNGSLNCANISFDISGGSKVDLSGKAKDLRMEGSGGSMFKLKDFSVANVDADLSGGSHATVTMNGILNSEQSGGSRLVYYGNMSLGDTDFSGGSGVSRGK